MEFDRDIFLLFRKRTLVSKKTSIRDELSRQVSFVESPAEYEQMIMAAVGGLAAAVLFTAAFIVVGLFLGVGKGEPGDIIILVGALAGPFLGVLAGLALRPKVHIPFYETNSQSKRLLEILQERRFRIRPFHSVRDSFQTPLGRLRTNSLMNFVQRKWRIDDAEGHLAASVKEDWLFLAILRRLVPAILRMIIPKSSYTVYGPDNVEVLGTLHENRLVPLGDPNGLLDRRLAVATRRAPGFWREVLSQSIQTNLGRLSDENERRSHVFPPRFKNRAGLGDSRYPGESGRVPVPLE